MSWFKRRLLRSSIEEYVDGHLDAVSTLSTTTVG
jgi:hypothetical protein